MSGSFRELPHTADTGVRIEADTIAELYEWAGRGMFGLMFDLSALDPERSERVVLEAPGPDELLVDLLAELLFRWEAFEAAPCRFTVNQGSAIHVDMEVGFAPFHRAELLGPPIKAVTYHDLAVEQGADGRWSAQIVFDV